MRSNVVDEESEFPGCLKNSSWMTRARMRPRAEGEGEREEKKRNKKVKKGG